MSIYRELMRGPVTTRIARPYGQPRPGREPDTILGRLSARNRRRRSDNVARYGEEERRRPRPDSRDREIEKERLDDDKKTVVKELEEEIVKKDEERRVDDTTLNTLKTEALLVEAVNLHIDENTEEHHTDLYECTERPNDPQLVVRRGQEFKMTFTFQRPWDGKIDDMYLTFKIGEEPNPRKETFVKIKLEERDDTSYRDGVEKRWGARIESQADNDLTVAVYTPPDVIVGEWEYSVRTVRGLGEKELEYEGPDDVIILFNPWCPDDEVYMENTDDLKEYINNENGLVFNGCSTSIGSKPWNYGQFQERILEASLHLLRKANSYSITTQMSSAVFVSRALSRIINDLDDNGVLSGRWDGDYRDGVRPTSWKGSVPILIQYLETKKPVKYGQCWVFSHLFTTVSRALGLPCRSVTNFSSAHDTDLSMTIDRYVDELGDEVDLKNGDSVWNFHVWNECWILRPDLDRLFGTAGKYDGWHAVDATPQELSDSVFQCGPAPLSAIRTGEVHVGYDTKFIFAEVNADRCTWQDGDPPVLLDRETKSVGKKISTKFPNGSVVRAFRGRDDGIRQDLTDLYKHAEGSAAEREAVEKATRQGRFGKILFENLTGLVITVLEDQDLPEVGEDITVKVKVENTSGEMHSVRMRITVHATNYWGGILGKEKVATKLYSEDKIEAGESKVYELPVAADDYLRLCDEQLSMRVLALGKVREFDDPVFGSETFTLKLPEIECEGPEGKVDPDEEFTVRLSFKNPLKKKPLTDCKLSIEGTVVVLDDDFVKKHGAYIKPMKDVKPGEMVTLEVKVKASVYPKKSPDRELEVGLASKELPDLEGALAIELDI